MNHDITDDIDLTGECIDADTPADEHTPADADADADRFTEYLAHHPRMIGALFTACLIISQIGSAAAATSGGTTPGP